jgi:hypothetical protein
MISTNFKYFGILKGFDFNKIDKYSFAILIDSGIFIESELSKYNEGNYEGLEEYQNNGFCDYFIFNKKGYYLKRDVLIEMIEFREQYLQSFAELDPIYYKIDEVITKAFFLEEKINALKVKYDAFLKGVKDLRLYNLYKNGSEINGYESWYEFFEEQIIDNRNFDSIALYLKGVDRYLPKKLEEDWNSYYTFLKISEYCEKKKNVLLNIKIPNMSETNNEINDKKRDMSFRLSLFEELMINSSKWADANATQKGNILTHMFGDHYTNIRDYYLETEKTLHNSKFKNGSKWSKEHDEAKEIIKKILG